MALDRILQVKKESFLESFGRIGTVTGAAQAVGISRQTHYDWLESDPDYPKAFADRIEEAADRLENEARRRAVAGVEEPVVYQGVIQTTLNSQGQRIPVTVRKYSDVLLIFLMKGAMPHKYRERGDMFPSGPPVNVQNAVIVVGGDESEYVQRFRSVRNGRPGPPPGYRTLSGKR